jgi:hypothetical protein
MLRPFDHALDDYLGRMRDAFPAPVTEIAAE